MVPSKLVFVVYDSSGHEIASGGDPDMVRLIPSVASLPAIGDIDKIPLPNGLHLRFATDTVLNAHFVAGATTNSLRRRQGRFLIRIALSVPFALILALAIGYSVSRWSLEPIDALATATDAISPGLLGDRLPVGSPPDELDRLTIRFNGLLDRIQALQEQSDAFLREVAHQIRTPLTLVLGEAELSLERERTAEEYVRTLRRVQAAASQMTHRVRDLLLLARMEAGERPPLRDDVELDALALEATDLFRARAQSLGQHLELGDVAPCEVAGDEALLREALLELLENACRHGQPGHPVAVSVRRDRENVRLEVSNAGAPIPASSMNGDTPQGRERTRGLGLSIMRWIASVHGGELNIRREGTENIVALVLPRASRCTSGRDGHLSVPAPATTLLVIDDEPQIRRVVRNAFQEGARILEAATGREGIDRAAAEQPDLIILDLGLPDMPGVDVCREVRQWSTAPILVLSARHSDEEKVNLLDAGADDYVTKPFSTTELQARARALLRRAQSTEQPGATRIEIGELALDRGTRTLTNGGEMVHLTPIERDLLPVLMSNAGKTLTHQHLYHQVWSGRPFGDARQYLRVYVGHLRQKIELDTVRPRYIITEAGVGYRFVTAAEYSRAR